MEQSHHFGTVFVKEDRETGKVVQKPRLFALQSVQRATRQSQRLRLSRAVKSHTHTHTHTHPFNGPFSGTTKVSRYQKGKTNLDFTEARGSE